MTHRDPLENRCGSPANKRARTSEDKRCKLTISDRCVSRWIYTIAGYDYMQSCTNEKRKKSGQSLWTLQINNKGGKSRMERPERKKDRVTGDIFVMGRFASGLWWVKMKCGESVRSERMEDTFLLAFKIEHGAISHEMWESSRSQQGQGSLATLQFCLQLGFCFVLFPFCFAFNLVILLLGSERRCQRRPTAM